MRTISQHEMSAVCGAGFLTTALGRVDNLATQLNGTLFTTGFSLNDALFSIVQLQGKDSSLELSKVPGLI